MSISSINNFSNPTQSVEQTKLMQPPSGGAQFEDFLFGATKSGMSTKEEIREAAEKLVSTTFIKPMFNKLRDDPFASDMFHGGQGEKIFQEQLDQIFSDRISETSNFDLIDSVADFFARGISDIVDDQQQSDSETESSQDQSDTTEKIARYFPPAGTQRVKVQQQYQSRTGGGVDLHG